MIEFIKEFLEFLKVRKKYWLLPIIIVLALFGILIVLSQGSAVAPCGDEVGVAVSVHVAGEEVVVHAALASADVA